LIAAISSGFLAGAAVAGAPPAAGAG